MLVYHQDSGHMVIIGSDRSLAPEPMLTDGQGTYLNSLAPREFSCNFKSVIFKLMSRIDILCTSFELAFWWMRRDRSDDYRKTSNIRRTVRGNKIVDHSDVIGASPVGAAPTTSSFSTWHLASRNSAKEAARHYENLLSVGIWCDLY